MIANIGIALILSGVLSFALFMIISKIKGDALNVVHISGLGVLFVLLSYQSYKLMSAWDERVAIEEAMDEINSLADNAVDFVDELDKQSGGKGDAGRKIREAMNNPLVQKGLALFGFDVNTKEGLTIEMGEKLKTKYNWYMFRRVCWMLGFMIVYATVAFLYSPTSGYNQRQRPTDRNLSRPSSHNRKYHSRRH